MRIALAGCRGVPALYSGFETAATEIGTRLVQRGHDVVVYCRYGYGDQSEREYCGIRKVYLPRLNFKVADTLSHTFFSFLHACVRPPDVMIVFNGANGPLCVVPRLRGIPFAVNIDGLEWKRAKWPWIGQRYFYFASWFCTKIAPALISDSRGIVDFYRKQWNTDSYYAAYGGYVQRSRSPEVLQEFGLKPRDYLLVVARMEPENNGELILSAFDKVDTDKRLVIVGGTNFKSEYAHRLMSSIVDPRVVFTGGVYDQEKLTELICNSYAYVHGHMVGGTNPILLTALGCGACVLYADVCFNAEVVGAAGVPFPLEIEGARAVFQHIVDHPDEADAYRPLGPPRITSAYSWDLITDRYEELCRRLHKRLPVYAEVSG